MKCNIFFLLLALVASSAGAQKVEKKKISPDEKITVKREFDKNGNLIGFDSLRVFQWSTDSNFQFPLDEGWKNFFGDDDIFRGFGEFQNDSSFRRNFFFHNDTSLFIGPHSSFRLPPGFLFPDNKEMQEMQKLFDNHFKSFSAPGFPGAPGESGPYQRFSDPRQQEEWDQLIKKHQAEMEQMQKLLEKQQKEKEEFMKRWDKKSNGKGLEKM